MTAYMTSDTICAPATASGGALCVVRVAGPEAITVADRVFTPRHGLLYKHQDKVPEG